MSDYFIFVLFCDVEGFLFYVVRLVFYGVKFRVEVFYVFVVDWVFVGCGVCSRFDVNNFVFIIVLKK